jgi:hypothetical protein
MKSRVFISCGQHSQREIDIAARIKDLLKKRHFDPYVAKEVQNIFEINSGIIGELKNSDCYLFINFRREPMNDKYRGSLFSNQEFAVAYALGFDRIIVVNEKDVRPEGMLAYIGCNTKVFETAQECLDIVEDALNRSGWEPSYSRRLRAENVRPENLKYTHFTRELMDGCFLSIDIANGRPDIAAIETSGRLLGFRRAREKDFRSSLPHHRSLLKASCRNAFSHTVFPGSSESFNILFIGTVFSPERIISTGTSGTSGLSGERVTGVYLNSALDLIPNPPLPLESGEWVLMYEFCAIGFPPLRVELSLRYGPNDNPEAHILRQYTASGKIPPRSRSTWKLGGRTSL